MKTASKVFLIMGMVILPLYAIMLFTSKDVMLEFLIQSEMQDVEMMDKLLSIMAIVMAVCSVIALVVGSLALQKLKTAKNKNELVLFGVLSIFFVNLLGGIFMLCVKNEDLNAETIAPVSEKPVSMEENTNQNQENE